MEANKIFLRPARVARIEIIPLIDVIFFLLATFVLFTLSLARIQSIVVPLPIPGEPALVPPVNIQISGDGSVYWDRESITMGELPAHLVSYKSREKDPKVVISGDEKARFGTTVLVLDELRKADIRKFSIETKTKATGQ